MEKSSDTGATRANSNLPDFGPAISLLRGIAAHSADALLTEGPVNPDRHLLELCAEALHHCKAEGRAEAQRRKGQHSDREDDALLAEMHDRQRRARPSLFAIRKLKATTPAGIYAKAAVVRASKTGAADLAMSLAIDLFDCEELRRSIWPAATVEA